MFRLNMTVNAVDEINALNASGSFEYLADVLPRDTVGHADDDDGRRVAFFSNNAEAVKRINAELAEAGSELEWEEV